MNITTGGKNMSAARTLFIIALQIALLIAAVFMGCSPDRSGTEVPNSPPRVFVVNSPPDSAQFSRNPELNWYATDIDGYIVFFRYAVVVDSEMVIGGQHVTPDVFAQQATDQQFGWDTANVTLDDTQTEERVRLHADVNFPIDSFIVQYFFIQAQDDRGAKSEIEYRMYSRNNHYPNTHFRARNVYINAKNEFSPADGISLEWFGADSSDWGRTEPPLEYEWRLYGPFDDTATIFINIVQENCVYDPILDSMVSCMDVRVLDLDAIPDELNGMKQPLWMSDRKHGQIGPNTIREDPEDAWVTDRQRTIYDVFAGLNLEETSMYKFVFWVRSRDDGFVPDPSPSFAQFYVVEALFENSVAVFDETGYTRSNGRWAPIDLDTVKAVFHGYIHGAGYTSFDTTGGVDFFFTANKKNQNESVERQLPDLLDVLSHRILISFLDDAETGLNENPAFGLLYDIFNGLDMGASGWVMSRNLADATRDAERFREFAKSQNFRQYFGISMVNCEGWWGQVISDPYNPVFNEEFVGAYANPDIGGYPSLEVDWGVDTIGYDTLEELVQCDPLIIDTVIVPVLKHSLLDSRYPRWMVAPDHVMQGLPEVGVCQKTLFSTWLYLYLSRDGDKSIFHGKVNAVAQQIGDMRSACFLFTPIAMDTISMQQVFTSMMAWLEEKFVASPSSSLKVPAYQSSGSGLAERRKRISQYLDYISFDASPEEKERYGITLKPVEITPSSVIR